MNPYRSRPTPAARGHNPTPRRRRKIVPVACLVALPTGAVAVDRVAAGRTESRTVTAFQEGLGPRSGLRCKAVSTAVSAASGNRISFRDVREPVPFRPSATPA